MQVANFWYGKTYKQGNWEIDVRSDFGPARVYDLKIQIKGPGSAVYMNGDGTPVGRVQESSTGCVMVVPRVDGKVPFRVEGGPVTFIIVACSGKVL